MTKYVKCIDDSYDSYDGDYPVEGNEYEILKESEYTYILLNVPSSWHKERFTEPYEKVDNLPKIKKYAVISLDNDYTGRLHYSYEDALKEAQTLIDEDIEDGDYESQYRIFKLVSEVTINKPTTNTKKFD